MTLPRATVTLNVNGVSRTIELEPRETLLDVLRERLDLTGAKRACDRGECGACAVLLDGQPVNACLMLALQVRGRKIVTIEGLAGRPEFKPILGAFVAHDAGQCGFCTPGFALAAHALLAHHPGASDALIRWELVGHVCRCNAYDGLAAAVAAARDRRKPS
jgi:aerobic-type carbon monoxide dehydrogenase small subunit (CoxS/CutS family)